MKAPLSWPNSSDATSPSGSAAQLTLTSARLARGDPLWMARATSSLPVPVSPVISTVESVAATRADPLQHVAQPGGGPDDPARRRRGRGDLLAQGEVLVLEQGPELLDLLEGERVRDRRGDRAGHVLEDLNLVG